MKGGHGRICEARRHTGSDLSPSGACVKGLSKLRRSSEVAQRPCIISVAPGRMKGRVPEVPGGSSGPSGDELCSRGETWNPRDVESHRRAEQSNPQHIH